MSHSHTRVHTHRQPYTQHTHIHTSYIHATHTHTQNNTHNTYTLIQTLTHPPTATHTNTHSDTLMHRHRHRQAHTSTHTHTIRTQASSNPTQHQIHAHTHAHKHPPPYTIQTEEKLNKLSSASPLISPGFHKPLNEFAQPDTPYICTHSRPQAPLSHNTIQKKVKQHSLSTSWHAPVPSVSLGLWSLSRKFISMTPLSLISMGHKTDPLSLFFTFDVDQRTQGKFGIKCSKNMQCAQLFAVCCVCTRRTYCSRRTIDMAWTSPHPKHTQIKPSAPSP